MLFLLSANTFALTEDYILFSQVEVSQQKREAAKQKTVRSLICKKYSLSENIQTSCLNTTKDNDLVKACLAGTSSEVSQSYCLITSNVTAEMAQSCYANTSSEKSEVACLVLSNKKIVKSESKINSCAGLGSLEEITCLKFNN